MTHNRRMSDDEGDFNQWQPSERRCFRKDENGKTCNAPVLYRAWESRDGGYEDYQYRCEVGHTWWVDGIDS